MTMHRLFDGRARPYILVDVKTNSEESSYAKKLFLYEFLLSILSHMNYIHIHSDKCKHWSDNNNFGLSWKAIATKLLLFFILASSINSAAKKSKVKVVMWMNWCLVMTKALNVNLRLLRRTVSITQSEKVEFISCKHCDKVFSWST